MKARISKEELATLKVGDFVERSLGGTVPMKMKVIGINERIICVNILEEGDIDFGPTDWEFHRETGAEIDEDLGWDGITITGSYLTKIIIDG